LAPEAIARRSAAADRIERRLKWLLPLSLVYAPALVVIGVSDLVDPWLGMSRRFDALFIIIGASALWGPLRLRRAAQRLRRVERRPVSRPQIAFAIASTLGSTAFVFAVGYLLGGWLIATLFVAATILLALALVLRARARVRARVRVG
jgi:hypothetical protein